MVFCVEPCLLTCIPYHFQGKLATPWKFTLELIIIPLLLVLKISLFLVRATRPHRKRPFSPLFVTLGTFASSIHFPYTFHTVSTHYLLLLLLFIRAQPEKLRLSCDFGPPDRASRKCTVDLFSEGARRRMGK